MKSNLPLLLAVLLSTPVLKADPVLQTFEGVTVSQPSALASEFPAGTSWTLDVAWDDAAVPDSTTAEQASYPLVTLTLTLGGQSGDWSSSAVMDAASFGLLKTTGYHEVQFTSGWGPSDHTTTTIGTFDVYSINLTLGDPTGTAVPALTPVPGSPFDLAGFSERVADSYLKVYLSDDGGQFILGGLGNNPVVDPQINVREGGTDLISGVSTLKFRPTRVGKRSATRVLLVDNKGLANLTGVSAVLTGSGRTDFTATIRGSKTISPGNSRAVQVRFTPKRPGKRTAALRLTSNDPSQRVFLVNLSGTGKSAKAKKAKKPK